MRLITSILFIIPLCLLIGCASPEYRIKKDPELFASFSPEVQEKVKQGQVDVGFTPEMVTMALGKPNRLYTRQSSTGTVNVWAYTGNDITTERQRVSGNFRYRDATGRYHNTSDWVWVDVTKETEYERIRVEFTEGKVSAIDTLQR